VTDQHTTYGTKIIVATKREAHYVLDEILGNATDIPVTEHATDTHGVTLVNKSVTWTRSTRPAAISARFSDRLPCERNGTSDSSLSRATVSTASPLTTVASGQSRGPSSVVDTTVAGRFLIRMTHGSRTSDSSVLEASIGTVSGYDARAPIDPST
jgi:hypothetical protein